MLRITASLISLCLVLGIWAGSPSAAYAKVISLSEPVAQDAQSRTFGTLIQSSLPQVAMSDLAQHPEQYTATSFVLQTPITKVCQKKGCFFITEQDDVMFRVSFRDYGFFIPTDSDGKTVTLMGQLVKKQRTQAQAEHFQQDMGENARQLAPGEVYEIVADAVRIPHS